MKERPILFSGAMVRACRREVDPKTQTRRTRGLERINAEPDTWTLVGQQEGEFIFSRINHGDTRVPIRCPYGVDGDRLWTRESLNILDWDDSETRIGACVQYAADEQVRGWTHDEDDKFNVSMDWGKPRTAPPPGILTKPIKIVNSMFMPRWASRDTLEVVSARPERLQCITDEDAKAEGICGPPHNFIMLWNSINGHTLPWGKNPWVWRVEFRRVQ